MPKKRKTLPKELHTLLENGDIASLKEQFLRCEPNAVTSQYGSNIFSLSPLPAEFAFWAKEQGADVNFKDYYGNTPIFYQASMRDGNVQLLIDLGAKIDVTQHDGTTPLHLAAIYGRTDAVKALLNAGADVNHKTEKFDGTGFLTPLEKTLCQNRLPYGLLLEICELLLNHGAKITERSRKFLQKSANHFQRVKRAIEDEAFLRYQTEGLEKLCQIFNVEPAAEIPFHDGVSPIHIPNQSGSEAFRWLWNYLVPPKGKAQTAQGEVIRIAGKVNNEIMANGGANWDNDYRKMLRVFSEYLSLGNPLKDEDIEQAKDIAKRLQDGQDIADLTLSLCAYAVVWVMQNPNVLPPLEADYMR